MIVEITYLDKFYNIIDVLLNSISTHDSYLVKANYKFCSI